MVADPHPVEFGAGHPDPISLQRMALSQHDPGRYPYLCVQMAGVSVHAQELAWHGQRVMIRYPLVISDRRHFSRTVICWVHRDQTRRIAREDALWNHPGDDIDWHEIEDEGLL